MSRRRFVIATLLGVPTAALVAMALAVSAWMLGIKVPLASGTTYLAIEKVAEAHYAPTPGEPVFLLAIGSDARPGQDLGLGDAIHLIGVNPSLGQATILNIPRDTYTPIPGHGTQKINNAFTIGGGRLMAEAVGGLVGVQIPYVISTDFAGLTAMVDDMGGLEVDVPDRHADPDSGSYFEPGPTHMSGDQALAFSRNRKGFPTGDIKRTENQGLLIISALRQLRAANTGAVGTVKALALLGRHTVIDGISLGELYNLARLGLSVDADAVRNVTMPSVTGSAGGASIVQPAGADGIFADFADDAVLQAH